MKLTFAKIRWYLKFLREAIYYSEHVKFYKSLKQIQKDIHDRYLEADRKSSPNLLQLEGQLTMINRIINGG